ncbi:MBL fold metallo-hydrolase [Mesorhizobium yinganensis]|uniref:MBL fold metallo-hydrolase n=1 Tax=Mesorhizobium yinganensis TaxID=3157707 RepID=UPI0032B724F7
MTATEIAPGILRLTEEIVSGSERSFFYLIQGSEADCLIDGGWGFGTGLDGFRANPEKPLLAVATHSHFDHIGLLHLAERRYGHRAEAAVFADPDPVTTQALPYLADRPVLTGSGTVEPASIRQTACPIDVFVENGDTVDLCDRRLTVLHTPGHSPGSLSLLEADSGLLFCADTVHDGHIWDDIPGADRAALLMSHERLAEVDFTRACPGHGAILPRAAFLDRIARYRRQADA